MKEALAKTTTNGGKRVLVVANHEAVGSEWSLEGVEYQVSGFGKPFKNSDFGRTKVCYAYIDAPAAPQMHSVPGPENKPCRKCGTYCYGDCSAS
jgi:hypothetical protein